ncbi:type II secretion system protein GspL [Azonexus sp. IMCC34839]|uniref:type II secretion system protein GspL n=1 Tax=Azonexus sp. IMCC34839 TaxID=3133695 RepID=UPI00399AA882
MTPTLILILPSDWPHARRESPWLLIDEAGRVVQRGCSEPTHWPIPAPGTSTDPTACVVLLAGRQVSHQRCRLPKKQATPEIAASALEDALLEETEHLLFAIAPGDDEHERSIGVVSAQRLDSLLAILPALGLAVRAVWPLGQVLPADEAWLIGDELTLALGNGHIVSLPIDAQLAAMLDALQGDAQALACVRFDRQLSLAATHTIDALSTARRLVAHSASCPALPAGGGFLYGPRQPKSKRAWELAPLFPGLRLAAAFAATIVALMLAQWGWLAWQGHNLRQEIAGLFHQVAPKATLVDPPRQLRRLVDDSRHAHGQLAGDDMIRLLAPLADLKDGGLAIDNIDYTDGRLRVLAELSGDELARLHAIADAQSIRLTTDSQAANGQGTKTTLLFTDGGRL